MNPPSEALREVALSICSGIGTPVSSAVAKAIMEERWKDLAEMRVHPGSYTRMNEYHGDVVAVSLLRKLPMPTGIDTKRAAEVRWLECEKQCAKTNMRFSALALREEYPLEEDLNDRHLQAQLRVLRCVRKWVHRLMGPVPSKIIGRPSKRATYELTRAKASVIDKLSSNPACTPRLHENLSLVDYGETAWLRGLRDEIFLEGPRQADSVIRPWAVAGNRFTTVPKDGTIDRPIACEPTLNVYAQLGVGDVLKRRLRRFGLLAIQSLCGFESQAWHRLLAQKASEAGDLVTIDLSSASDTVAYGVVQALVHPKWMSVLDVLRSPRTEVGSGKDKKVFLLEKISSMGNGFTFELETTIFAAISAAALELSGIKPRFPFNLSVYGDDIIAPVEASKLLLDLLAFFGFTPNKQKSFTSGPFRESCGGDYWSGEAVRPVFIEEDPVGPLGWYSLHNKIFKLAKTFKVRRALEICKEQLPYQLRANYGPIEFGDSVLHTDKSRDYNQKLIVSKKLTEPSGYWAIRALLPVVPSRDRARWDDQSGLAAVLYGIGDRIPLWDPDVDEVRGYRSAWVAWG